MYAIGLRLVVRNHLLSTANARSPLSLPRWKASVLQGDLGRSKRSRPALGP